MFKGIIRVVTSYTLILFSLLLGVSLLSFSFNDIFWYTTDFNTLPSNWLDVLGVQTASPFMSLYGQGSWIWVLASVYTGTKLLTGILPIDLIKSLLKFQYLALVTSVVSALSTNSVPFEAGGLFGSFIMSSMVSVLSPLVSGLLATMLLVFGGLSLFPPSFFAMLKSMLDSPTKLSPITESVDIPPQTITEDLSYEEDPQIQDQSYQEQRHNYFENEDDVMFGGVDPLVSNKINEIPTRVQTPDFLQKEDTTDETPFFMTKKRLSESVEPRFLRDVDIDLLQPYHQSQNAFYQKLQEVERESAPAMLELDNALSSSITTQIESEQPSSFAVTPFRLSFSEGMQGEGLELDSSFDQPITDNKISNPQAIEELSIDFIKPVVMAEFFPKNNDSELERLDTHVQEDVESNDSVDSDLDDENIQHATKFPPKEYDDNTISLVGMEEEIKSDIVLLDHSELTDSEKILLQGVERTVERASGEHDLFKAQLQARQEELATIFNIEYPEAYYDFQDELKDILSKHEKANDTQSSSYPSKMVIGETTTIDKPVIQNQPPSLLNVIDSYSEEIITPDFMNIDKEFAQQHLSNELLELRRSSENGAYMPRYETVSDFNLVDAVTSVQSAPQEFVEPVQEHSTNIITDEFTDIDDFMIMSPEALGLKQDSVQQSELPTANPVQQDYSLEITEGFDDSDELLSSLAEDFTIESDSYIADLEFQQEINTLSQDVAEVVVDQPNASDIEEVHPYHGSHVDSTDEEQYELDAIVEDADEFTNISPEQDMPSFSEDLKPLPVVNIYSSDDILQRVVDQTTEAIEEPSSSPLDIEFRGDSIVFINGKPYIKQEDPSQVIEQESAENVDMLIQTEELIEESPILDEITVDTVQPLSQEEYILDEPTSEDPIEQEDSSPLIEQESAENVDMLIQTEELIEESPILEKIITDTVEVLPEEEIVEPIAVIYSSEDEEGYDDLDLKIDLDGLSGLIDEESEEPIVYFVPDEISQILQTNDFIESEETDVNEIEQVVDFLADYEPEDCPQTQKSEDRNHSILEPVPVQESNPEEIFISEPKLEEDHDITQDDILTNIIEEDDIEEELLLDEILEDDHNDIGADDDIEENFLLDEILEDDQLENEAILAPLELDNEKLRQYDNAPSFYEEEFIDDQALNDDINHAIPQEQSPVKIMDRAESALMPTITTHAHLIQPEAFPTSDLNDEERIQELKSIEDSIENLDKNSLLVGAGDLEHDIREVLPETQETTPIIPKEYQYPTVEILDPNTDHVSEEQESVEIEDTMKMIEDTYESFNINMQVVDYSRGPTITRFELEPPSGLKLRTIFNLQDDLALQAGTSNIRIISPVEGRSYIGIEVPNKIRRQFLLREQIESVLFQENEAELPLILGVDVGGKEIVSDLATTPHLLIAGTTGSGKSVYVNALILGLLYKLSPEDLRFIMIDPKMVELELYSGIPHLLAPIITRPEEAMAALEWAVQEMDRRYKILSELGVRNIKEYKSLALNPENAGLEKLPYIVIIVDEFANLMLRAPKDTERHISRLASMSRAVGMHLVLATQRPSVDVVTGVIKANFPSRIAFRVSSKIDSRTILDKNGAETLLGRGDMLFMSPNYMDTVRIQSPYASSEDVARVVNTIKQNGAPDYVVNFSDLLEKEEEKSPENARTDAMSDPLFEEVLRYAVDNGEISASGIQRRFRVGYNRASRLIESMKDLKIISPPPSAGKGWLINITKDQVDSFLDA